MPADPPVPLAAATARRSAVTRPRAIAALGRLDRTGSPITFSAVAEAAGVSRSWLYRTPDIRAEIERLRPTDRGSAPRPAVPSAHRATEASRQQRIETLLADIAVLRDENRKLRAQLAARLGAQRAERVNGPAPGRFLGPCS